MKLISSHNITMGYEGRIAVENVDIEIHSGDYICIVGENGSGKSTFIKGLLGLQKPMSGSFDFHGIHANEIGYLPQQLIVQKDFPASVHEVVLSGCLNRTGLKPFYSKDDHKRTNDNIERLGLSLLKKKSYRDLSGGQQQRVLLARALCATEHLLLLDEPVTGLDPIVTNELYDYIKALNTQHQITVIMVSHDIKSAIAYGNKILHLDHKPLFWGAVEDYVKTPFGIRMIGGYANA